MDRSFPKFTANVQIKIGNSTELMTFRGPVPEKLMSVYESIIGNGLAKVSVSTDFSLKEFGTGVSSMASVTLTCNQDPASIAQASNIAGELSRDMAQQHAMAASEQYAALRQAVKK